MVEEFLGFGELVRRYGLQRSEGVVLRYLSQVYKTLDQNVPDQAKTETVWDVVGFLRAMLERVDSSLLEEWESLVHPELRLQGEADSRAAHRALVVQQLASDPRALTGRVRAELHTLVRALSRSDWEDAADAVRQGEAGTPEHWPPERIAEALGPFLAAHGELLFDHRARLADKTALVQEGPRTWRATQVLCDPDGEDLWHVEAEIDLSDPDAVDGPLIALRRIGT
jgi:hypothetical protein